MEQSEIMYHLVECNAKNVTSLLVFLPKMHKVNLIKRRLQISLNGKAFYKIMDLYMTHKSVMDLEVKERLRDYFESKETKVPRQINATYDSDLDP